MVVYGINDTMKLLEGGAIGKIICFEGNYLITQDWSTAELSTRTKRLVLML